jgi:hypothetical protein
MKAVEQGMTSKYEMWCEGDGKSGKCKKLGAGKYLNPWTDLVSLLEGFGVTATSAQRG